MKKLFKCYGFTFWNHSAIYFCYKLSKSNFSIFSSTMNSFCFSTSATIKIFTT